MSSVKKQEKSKEKQREEIRVPAFAYCRIFRSSSLNVCVESGCKKSFNQRAPRVYAPNPRHLRLHFS